MKKMKAEDALKTVAYEIWLQKILGAGSAKLTAVLDKFGTAYGVYASRSTLRNGSNIFSEKETERADSTDISYAYKVIEKCRKDKIHIVGYESEEYPDILRNIPDPPAVIYYKGVLPDFDNTPTVCIVGPRKVSKFGEKAAFSLAYRFSLAGITVVSGVAFGSDSAALKGTLKGKGRAVAVMPCGLSYDYLSDNRPLRKNVLESTGCVLSEYPPEVPVAKNSFEVRNRILSGLASGTVIIEAGEHSGALITARHANEQGRDVFVIPGNPTLPQYQGSNRLISDGAAILIDANTVFNQYIPVYGDKINTERAFDTGKTNSSNIAVEKKSSQGLSKYAEIVYNSLNKQKFTVDDLLGLGISDNNLLSSLTELEMFHFIEALPGGFYTLK